jgi:hypothetical protein
MLSLIAASRWDTGFISSASGFPGGNTPPLRFNPVEPDWGHYPGIYFMDSGARDNPRQYEYALVFSINWSDNINKKFRLTNGDGSKILSSTIPATNEWCDVEFTYYSTSGTIDLTIRETDGSTFRE